jgi:hypothetical protein
MINLKSDLNLLLEKRIDLTIQAILSDSYNKQSGRVVMRDQVRILREQVLYTCN